MKKSKTTARPNFPNTRKALRKQKRQQKKIHRQEHYLKKKNSSEQPKYYAGRFVKRPADDSESAPEPKKKKQKQNLQPSAQDILSREQQKEKKEVQRLNSQMEEQRRKIFLKANEDEDKVIKKLEKQLGLNKSKNKNSYFADDGLDLDQYVNYHCFGNTLFFLCGRKKQHKKPTDLLEICERSTSEQIVAAEKHLADVEGDSDFEEDLATVTGKKVAKLKDKAIKKKEELSDAGNSEDSNEETVIKNIGRRKRNSEDDESDDEELSDNETEDEESIQSNVNDESDISDDGPEEKPIQSQTSKSNNKLEKDMKNVDDTKNRKVQSKTTEKVISEEDLSKVFSDDEVSHLSDDEEELSGDVNEEINEKSKDKPDVWEDIYGRKRDKEGNVIKEEKGIYIPPHLRNKDAISDKELAQLKRQVKSVLNKLAGTNLHWACSSIEGLYASHSRNSVNTALTQLWLDAVAGPDSTPDRMVAEHAALVSVLHANVGSEIGAHFLQELTKRFDSLTADAALPLADKTLDNLVSCLAHLYSFKIFHANLLYDLLKRLLEEITEKRVGCVVIVLRCVGGVLRRDEPQALRDFIQETQAKVAGINESAADGTRIKFLLEVLMAVKNNNLTKIPNYDPSYTEQLKKLSRGVVRKGNYVSPLNIRLEDLLKADERGKWWVVGSAWEGNRTLPDDKSASAPSIAADQKLLELARKQRMNTDVRRSIFCVIMAAEDYMDAFEKLQHLGLKGRQEREVVHVLLACCLQEASYNAYYAVLAQKLCDTDRKYQLCIQFAAWDNIKELDGLSKQAGSNLAQFLVHLIMSKGLALSVLKIIQFSDLTKRSVRFMRQILLAIILHDDLQGSLEVFHRVSKPAKLHLFRESVRLFVKHFLLKNAGNVDGEESGKLRERTSEVDRILCMHESKMKL